MSSVVPRIQHDWHGTLVKCYFLHNGWYGNKCEYKHKMAIPHSENWTIMLQEDYAPKEMNKAGPWQTRLFPTSQDYKGFKHMQQLKPEAII